MRLMGKWVNDLTGPDVTRAGSGHAGAGAGPVSRHLTRGRCVLLVRPAMLLRISPFCRIAIISGTLMVGGRAIAQLAANSPFLPQGAAAAAPTANAALEYRGYMDTPTGERLFRINDTARKTGAFIKLGEKHEGLGLALKQYDADRNSITIEHEGKTVTLQRREAKIASAGPAAQLLPAMPVANVSPAVTQSVVVNPTTADEQRRLEAVAAEVARRRALREQSGQQLNQGAAPAPMLVPPQMAPPPATQFQQRNAQGGAVNPSVMQPQNGQRRPMQNGARQQR